MLEQDEIIAEARKDMHDAIANLTFETQREGFTKFWNAVDRSMNASSENARLAQHRLMKEFMQSIADGLREHTVEI